MTNIFERYQSVRIALKPVLGLWNGAMIQDYTALTAMTLSGDPDYLTRQIGDMAQSMKTNSAGLGTMRDSMRFLMAPILVSNKTDMPMLATQLLEGKAKWKQAGLSIYDPYKTMSLMSLHILGRSPNDAAILVTIKSEYDAIKKAFFWTAGEGLLPFITGLSVINPGRLQECVSAMTAFKEAGLPDATRHEAAIFSLIGDQNPTQTAAKVKQAVQECHNRKLKLAAKNLPVLSLATISDMNIDELLHEAVLLKEKFKTSKDKPRGFEDMALNLAFFERLDSSNHKIVSISTLSAAMQAFIAYQAVMAATAGATAAVVAGTT